MDSESQIALFLAQVDTGARELEHTLANFEQAVSHAELCLKETETGSVQTEDDLQQLTRTLQASQEAAMLVRAANTALDFALSQAETAASIHVPAGSSEPLPAGTLICDGRYRLLNVLYSRPRMHLYLARRVPNQSKNTDKEHSLVAIRELILAGLPPALRQGLVRAAFEEFAAPQFLGSPHLPGVGDHLYLEEQRHYLIMQPRQARGSAPAFVQPLSERLLNSPRLDMSTALHLGTHLCQTVARLHRQALYLGELTPATILVDHVGHSSWAPILLASWPPAPSFWSGQSKQAALRTTERAFPTAGTSISRAEQDGRPFAAPEIFSDQRDPRSDVYALGAILYLLCTGHTPPSASQRQRHQQVSAPPPRSTKRAAKLPQAIDLDITLPGPRTLNQHISPLLEQIIVRSLALDPDQRFASVRDLAEALESLHFKAELPATPPLAAPFPRAKASRLRRLFAWLKR